MDVITLLKKDHKKVNALLKRGEKTTEQQVKQREELFNQIKQELKLHEELEETYFYPPLKRFEKTRSLIFEAFEEHALANDVIAKLEKVAYDSEEWTARFTLLKEVVKHHVDEEEGELFPKVQKILDKNELKDIASKMLELKQRKK